MELSNKKGTHTFIVECFSVRGGLHQNQIRGTLNKAKRLVNNMAHAVGCSRQRVHIETPDGGMRTVWTNYPRYAA